MKMTDPQSGETYFRKRRRRFDEEMMPRELTFSCYRKYRFFSKERTCAWFVEKLQEVRSEWPVDVWAWVLMPDHAHLIVAPRLPNVKIGRFAGNLKERVARSAIGWLKDNSPAWLEKITVIEGNRTRRRFWQPGGGYDRATSSLSRHSGR
jgi:putative transposase